MSGAVSPADFCSTLAGGGVELYAGVPDSLLQDLCAYLQDHAAPGRHVITANEGNAVALAMGYHLATGRHAAVYLQNSGLGNLVNPLLSLADPDVYSVPMLLVVGWRGEPGVKDEPQHVAQGRLTLELLQTLGVPHQVLAPETWREQVADALATLAAEGRPVALVVRRGFFARYPGRPAAPRVQLSREQALAEILGAIGRDSFVVSTTGKTSREVFEIRQQRGEDHSRDFLTVGGMGHAASIAMGMSLGSTAPVYCIDGDGALLMHLGSLPVAARQAPDNFRYLVINNGAHESVGGQPTVADELDLAAVLRACGFDHTETVATAAELPAAVARLAATPRSALVVLVDQGSRADLGRPTTTPRQNKSDLMAALAAGTR